MARGAVTGLAGTIAMVAALAAGAASAAAPKPKTPEPPPVFPAANLLDPALRALGGAEEVVFAVRALYDDGHYYANFGHWAFDPNKMMYAPGGSQLCKLNLRTRQVTMLVDDPRGSVRDPAVHYDGKKILFSYRPGGTKYFHLYEIGVDGKGMRQLTDGPFDDIEPAYLPDGGIVFPSSRCRKFVPCWYTPVAILHRMDPDGGNIRPLSSNIVHDNTPSVMADGRVMYTRWEYVDRAPQKFHGLWSMNPDGTNQQILFGNTQPPGIWVLMIDGKVIPGTDRVVAVFSPGHGNREHAGAIMLVDLRAGPDDPRRARQISPDVKMANGWMGGRDGFRDPYPICENLFLTARDKTLYLLDDKQHVQELHVASEMINEPVVIRPRQREPLVPQRTDLSQSTGRLVLSDVCNGQKMTGVKPGEIRQLLVLEQLPKPVNFSGVQQNLSMNGTFTLKRILGTVPVEPDGSAYFEAPALRSIYFAALDQKGQTVQRMHSFITLMPGEATGCVGCHEHRASAAKSSHTPAALSRAPSKIQLLEGVPDVIDYPRDIQPIWDRHCVRCHSAEKPDGRALMTGDYNEWFTISYYTLFSFDQVSDSEGYSENGNYGPRQFGSPASALMKKLDGAHYEVKLSPHERQLVQMWIDTGATYPGTYGALRPGIPPSPGHTRADPNDFPPTYGSVSMGKVPGGDETLDAILKRRCMNCHDAKLPLGRGFRKVQIHLNVPRHYGLNLYDLSHPEDSLVLKAPLGKSAGGYDWCRAKSAAPATQPSTLFTDTKDKDFQSILRAIELAKTQLFEMKRFDMPGYRPTVHYVREMQRYGILPESFDLKKDPIDVYQVDQAYWRSLWHHPAPEPGNLQTQARE